MAIISILDLSLKPDLLDEAPAVITQVLEATRGFAGNLGVEVVVDITDPAHYSVIERWESVEADDAYRAFRASPEGKNPLGSLLNGPPQLSRYYLAGI